VTKRPRFLIVAVLLTFLDFAVVVCHGWPVWTTWSGDLWSRGLSVLLAALGATPLANIWVQAGASLHAFSVSQSAIPRRNAMPIAARERGRSDV